MKSWRSLIVLAAFVPSLAWANSFEKAIQTWWTAACQRVTESEVMSGVNVTILREDGDTGKLVGLIWRRADGAKIEMRLRDHGIDLWLRKPNGVEYTVTELSDIKDRVNYLLQSSGKGTNRIEIDIGDHSRLTIRLHPLVKPMEVGLPESEWKIATTPDDVGLDRLKYTIQMIQLAVLGSAL